MSNEQNPHHPAESSGSNVRGIPENSLESAIAFVGGNARTTGEAPFELSRKAAIIQRASLVRWAFYNVLEKLRSGELLTAKKKLIHDQGLVTVLCQIHDELDEAVLEAYGWCDLPAKGTHCSGGLRPSIANEEAPSLVPIGIDAHRATLQETTVAPDGTPRQARE